MRLKSSYGVVKFFLLALLSLVIALSINGLQIVSYELNINRIDNYKNSYRLCLYDSSFNMHTVQIPLNFPVSSIVDLPLVNTHTTSIPFYGHIQIAEHKSLYEICGVDNSYFSFWNLKVDGFAEIKQGELLLRQDIFNKYFSIQNSYGQSVLMYYGDTTMVFTIKGTYKAKTQLTYIPEIIISNADVKMLVYNTLIPHEEPVFIHRKPTYRIDLTIDGNSKSTEQLLNNLYEFTIDGRSPNFYLDPIKNIYFGNQNLLNDWHRKGNKYYSIFIIIFSLFLLLNVSLNIAIFYSGLAIIKLKDYSIRRIHGASKSSLFFLSMKRTVFDLAPFFLLGFLLSFFVSESIRVFFSFNHINYELMNWGLILSVFFVLFSVIAISGSFSSLILMKVSPITSFYRGNFSSTLRRNYFYGVQYIQIMVFIAAFLWVSNVSNQIRYITGHGVGWHSEGLYIFDISNYNENKKNVIRQELQRVPDIISFSQVRAVPPIKGGAFVQLPSLGNPQERIPFSLMPVDYAFANTMNFDFIEGGDFTIEKYSLDGSYYFILNRSALHAMGITTALGEPWAGGTVIGVVDDFIPTTAREEIRPIAMYLSPQHTRELVVRVANREALDKVQETLNLLNHGNNVSFKSHKEIVYQAYKEDFKLLEIVKIIAFLTLAIGLLGLLGIVYFTNQTKRREYAIRKMLGCGVFSIAFLINKPLAIIFVLASLPAIAISYYILNVWLKGFVYSAPYNLISDVSYIIVLYSILFSLSLTQVLNFKKISISKELKAE